MIQVMAGGDIPSLSSFGLYVRNRAAAMSPLLNLDGAWIETAKLPYLLPEIAYSPDPETLARWATVYKPSGAFVLAPFGGLQEEEEVCVVSDTAFTARRTAQHAANEPLQFFFGQPGYPIEVNPVGDGTRAQVNIEWAGGSLELEIANGRAMRLWSTRPGAALAEVIGEGDALNLDSQQWYLSIFPIGPTLVAYAKNLSGGTGWLITEVPEWVQPAQGWQWVGGDVYLSSNVPLFFRSPAFSWIAEYTVSFAGTHRCLIDEPGPVAGRVRAINSPLGVQMRAGHDADTLGPWTSLDAGGGATPILGWTAGDTLAWSLRYQNIPRTNACFIESVDLSLARSPQPVSLPAVDLSSITLRAAVLETLNAGDHAMRLEFAGDTSLLPYLQSGHRFTLKWIGKAQRMLYDEEDGASFVRSPFDEQWVLSTALSREVERVQDRGLIAIGDEVLDALDRLEYVASMAAPLYDSAGWALPDAAGRVFLDVALELFRAGGIWTVYDPDGDPGSRVLGAVYCDPETESALEAVLLPEGDPIAPGAEDTPGRFLDRLFDDFAPEFTWSCFPGYDLATPPDPEGFNYRLLPREPREGAQPVYDYDLPGAVPVLAAEAWQIERDSFRNAIAGYSPPEYDTAQRALKAPAYAAVVAGDWRTAAPYRLKMGALVMPGLDQDGLEALISDLFDQANQWQYAIRWQSEWLPDLRPGVRVRLRGQEVKLLSRSVVIDSLAEPIIAEYEGVFSG